MSEPVKKRTYSSELRRDQAAQTRARILDAAAELFVAEGYGRTTVRGIAARANVANDTVYAAFGSKVRILTALVDQRLAPSGEASVLDRPETHAVRDETDRRRQLQVLGRHMAAISAHVRPMYEILRTASAVEPEAAATYAEMEGYRLRNMTQVARWVAARGKLRVGVERAGEIIWTLASPDVARMLCDVRGWTERQHGQWLADVLTQQLLPDE
jgi:AcrR family transcriptional regulator